MRYPKGNIVHKKERNALSKKKNKREEGIEKEGNDIFMNECII
jgi:hypothetical protein